MTRQRIKVGEDYAIRDESGTLIETGWIDPEDGSEHPDVERFGLHAGKPKIDGANPAAMVPFDQKWA